MKKRLITSALPYVNNIPHLGNLIQVLSADVFARYCRAAGYETLYICGTDEYGTATETKALEEGISPRELCDRYHDVHTGIYDWFNIAFDKFGRTSDPAQTRVTQSIFLALDRNGYIKEKTIEQLHCEACGRFLADRYVTGVCPHCSYEGARGDQCENCGKLLEPTELHAPRCLTCGEQPWLRETRHLYIDLPAIRPRLEAWLSQASARGHWAKNAVRMTEAWIRDGLKERAITRDLKWGIPVPKRGFEDKVFYVWFDAPIGYISITAAFTHDWETWWRNPEDVELFQFIGKDNIPFHTVIFPSSLLGSGERWTMLHHMSSTEYLNYEGGKFSKSKGVGVFGNDARETGIPADVWRFYIFYNRPETSDFMFTWKDFQEKVNAELVGNLGNLVNRTLTFAARYFDARVPRAAGDESFWSQVLGYEKKIQAHYERAELREAFRACLDLASFGNKAFQDGEPWKTRVAEPAKAAALLHDLVYLLHDLAILVRPVMPSTADRLAGFLGMQGWDFSLLARCEGLDRLTNAPEVLFSRIESPLVEELKSRFSGTQQERAARDAGKDAAAHTHEELFDRLILLKTARIVKIERHPKAEKLYIETIDMGDEERVIVSGLVPYYSEEELLGRNIVVAANLRSAKLRGVESKGMLLAAEHEGMLEVLGFDDLPPGSIVHLEGRAAAEGKPAEISIDEFFSVPLRAEDGLVKAGAAVLCSGGRRLATARVLNGAVG